MTKIILKKGREDSLLRFHPWVFSGAIAQIVGEPAEGDVVGVFSQSGEFLAYGHYQVGSIAVRVLSFAGEDVLSPDFWKNMVRRALRVRIAAGLASPVPELVEGLANTDQSLRQAQRQKEESRLPALTNCYRLIHGEGDGLPGLIVDYYDASPLRRYVPGKGCHLRGPEISLWPVS